MQIEIKDKIELRHTGMCMYNYDIVEALDHQQILLLMAAFNAV